ncbi:MAG: response regulator [Eubacterium sp.]|nr:response regulator [Eubacterium sp.]
MSENKKPCVLIVDDVQINRMILSSLLASQGVASELAEGGKECIDKVTENDYDLILLDHRMPEIDGVDTLMKLKEIFLKKGSEVPVVCHTTEDAQKNINLYKAAGFADVLIKPIQPKVLSEILMTYLPGGKEIEEKLHADEEKEINRKLNDLPQWIREIDGIDARAGIINCDTGDDYIEALEIYEASVSEKADEIQRLADDADIKVYVLKVHSLKSMSRLIGATELSDMAYELELAGKNGDIDKICKKTPELLAMYRKLGKELTASMKDKSASGASDDVTEHGEKGSASDEMINDAYESIKEFVTSYDSESISMVLNELEKYTIPERHTEKINKIKKAFSELDWEMLRRM